MNFLLRVFLQIPFATLLSRHSKRHFQALFYFLVCKRSAFLSPTFSRCNPDNDQRKSIDQVSQPHSRLRVKPLAGKEIKNWFFKPRKNLDAS
ncbi:hypothetical protein L596_022466 [Steinernema carpocapsae]|uniref:Uncharacterized protein n=1 Tax=Steinernema carpocapsae TaxID=34508 RepID=A0A4U5MLS0_STECR|nr:hypothetical protein L596_022466 [Steinernema carpocapsae]